MTRPETTFLSELASPLRLVVDESALAANWRALDRLSGRASAGAAVKADGYGLGARCVSRVLRDAGCRTFFVAHCREAQALLGVVPASEIAVLHGPGSAEDIAFLRQSGVVPVLNTPAQAHNWQLASGGPAHVMIDSGINRLGFDIRQGFAALDGIAIDLLLSHLASAEDSTLQNEEQRSRFADVRAALPHRRASLANSAGIALGSDYHLDLTRPGIALYGGVPCEALSQHISQVAFPEAQVLQIRQLEPGDRVGYNATFTAERPMRVAVASLGYADGFLRAWSNGAGMLRWHGAALPVLGRVSMDMVVVDAEPAGGLAEGDWLGLDYALLQASQRSGLSQYELLTLLGMRFEKSGK